jgi:DNA-binding Xre family transcriptional regulator
MHSHPQTHGLVDALKKLLRARGATYRDLAKALGLSEPSIKRLFSERTLTLTRIEEICAFLEVDFLELAKLARGAATTVNEMSVEQEKALATDPRLLGVFYLVFNDWKVDDIVAHYALTRAEALKLLLRLDRLKLADLLPGDQVRLRVPKGLRLRPDGPIRRAHGRSVVASFLQADFAKLGGLFRFEFREITKASFAQVQRRLERVAAEFNELAELDSYLPSAQRETIGMALGVRPWVMSWVTGLKPRAAANTKPVP